MKNISAKELQARYDYLVSFCNGEGRDNVFSKLPKELKREYRILRDLVNLLKQTQQKINELEKDL